MFAQMLFHPDHVIPAAEFEAALVESADQMIAEMFMELYAVQSQVFVFCLRITDTGIGSENVLKRKRLFQRFIQGSADACSFFIFVQVDGSLHVPAIGRSGAKGAGIGVADDSAVLFGDKIGVFLCFLFLLCILSFFQKFLNYIKPLSGRIYQKSANLL